MVTDRAAGIKILIGLRGARAFPPLCLYELYRRYVYAADQISSYGEPNLKLYAIDVFPIYNTVTNYGSFLARKSVMTPNAPVAFN